MSPRRLPRCLAITGLGTFVGDRLARGLLERPSAPRIVGLDLKLPRRLEGRIEFRRVDLTEPTADSAVAEILDKERCDALLHAAFFSDPYPDIEYSHELEVVGSLHVMNAVAAAGTAKLVVMSSAQVYGARPDNPNFLTEDHPLRGHPDAHAVQDRVEMEQLLGLFARRHSAVTVTVLRPCWISGPNYENAITRRLERDRVTAPLGYDPMMQLLHPDDLLAAVDLALERDAPGAFNLAGDGPLPFSTLLRIAGKRARRWPHPLLYRLEYLESMSRSGDPPAGFYDYLRFLWVVDTARARARLGFEPLYSTREAWMSFVVGRRLQRYR